MASPDQDTIKSTSLPRRTRGSYVRHKVLFPLEIGFEDSRRTHMQTNATDIGGRGCYVETLLSFTHRHKS